MVLRCVVGLTADRFTGWAARLFSDRTVLLREEEVDLTAFELRPVVDTFDLVLVAAFLVAEVPVTELLLAEVLVTLLLVAEVRIAELPVRWVAWRLATVPDLFSVRPL